MSVPIFTVDAFTYEPFSGNPAGVCLLKSSVGAGWMASVAREMNLPETAFLFPEGDGYRLRWFTPEVEVDLCGHATLASAHILWETGALPPGETARFFTNSGWLTAVRAGAAIEMDFPTQAVQVCDTPSGLLEALGVTPENVRFIGSNGIDYLVELADQPAVVGVHPDFRALAQVQTRGVIITAVSAEEDSDFVSRFFAPASGISEDPVTGSAHCALGPFWAERFGRDELIGYQASSRGGVVRVKVVGERTLLRGATVTVMRGELFALPM